MTRWPIHFMAVLPVPMVISMSHDAHMLPGSHLHVCLPLVGASLPSGVMCVPVYVPLRTNGLSAACSGPGFGGVISAPAGAALPPDAVAAGFSALPDGAGLPCA